MLNFRKISAASDGAAIRAYMTQDQPEPESLKVHGVALDGRDLETGERLTAYYTGRGDRANWRPDMDPRVAAALGIASARAAPRDGQLDALFEARRADTGEDWSQHVRKNSGFDFVFAPHKSVSLAAEFAPTEAERQMIRRPFTPRATTRSAPPPTTSASPGKGMREKRAPRQVRSPG